ncbi:T9SS type A sorting domain-containing protein, partial [candidate division WOR-3 bacterium]|nr:T9SS type A sorting domain-containing protein [candidate division WOR-3 bacterium]
LTSDCLTPGHLQLTVTCANNLPYLDSIPVMSSGRYVVYASHYATDSAPGGNGDGVINPGEEVDVWTWVRNCGNQAAENVTGRLVIHEAGVTVTRPTVSFGNIPGEDSALSQTGFGVRFDPGLPDEFSVNCSLICRDNLDSTWVSRLTLHSCAALPYFVSVGIRDSTGLWPNGRLDPGEEAELEITIGNSGLGNAFEVRGVLRATDTMFSVTDTHAFFGAVPSGSTRTCTDRFVILAHPHLPPGSRLHCELVIAWDHGNDTTVTFNFSSGGIVPSDPVPDSGPVAIRYYAYDDGDAFYTEAPTYNWLEINECGTPVELEDQQTVAIALPDGFGPFIFYGGRFDSLSICSNGWLAPGVTTDRSWQNRALPTNQNRALLAPLWDDLYPEYGGGVWCHHFEDEGRFVVEWDSVHYSWARGEWDKFQVVILDTSQAAEDGNSVFLFQYQTANNCVSNTVGCQDGADTATGIGLLYNQSYHPGSLPLEPGRAIKFTTNPPELTGVGETAGTPAPDGRRRLVVAPNPFSRATTVHWNLEQEADVDLRVFDAAGREVRKLVRGRSAAGSHSTTWNGRDDAGRELARGIYFLRMVTPGFRDGVKVTVSR